MRWLAAVAPLSFVAACGGGSSSSPDGGETAVVTTRPADVVTTRPADVVASAEPTSTGGAPSLPGSTVAPVPGSNAPLVTFDTGTGSTTPAVINSIAVGVSGERPDSLPVRPDSINSPLPEVVVRHLQSATYVQLKDLLPAEKPLLVWFWAPH